MVWWSAMDRNPWSTGNMSSGLSHSLHSNKGGYTQMPHNTIRDIFATIMREVCYDVEMSAQTSSGSRWSFVHETTTTEDETWLEISANNLWHLHFFIVKFSNRSQKKTASKTPTSFKNFTKRGIKLSRDSSTSRKAPSTLSYCLHLWRWTISHKGNHPNCFKNGPKATPMPWALLRWRYVLLSAALSSA